AGVNTIRASRVLSVQSIRLGRRSRKEWAKSTLKGSCWCVYSVPPDVDSLLHRFRGEEGYEKNCRWLRGYWFAAWREQSDLFLRHILATGHPLPGLPWNIFLPRLGQIRYCPFLQPLTSRLRNRQPAALPSDMDPSGQPDEEEGLSLLVQRI